MPLRTPTLNAPSSLFPLSLLLLSLTFSWTIKSARCDPLQLPFSDCFDANGNGTHKVGIDSVYGQVVRHADDGTDSRLNLTVFGTSPVEIDGFLPNSNLGLCLVLDLCVDSS
jgi:hypothetical protein